MIYWYLTMKNKQELINELSSFFENHSDFYSRYKKTNDTLELWCTEIAKITKIKPKLSEENPLTLREMICLILLSIGINPAQCADLLKISINSLARYEERIRKKLRAHNRTHAFYLATIRGCVL